MKILYIENHMIFAKTVCELFLTNHDVTISPAISESKLLLKEQVYDLVIIDYDLDDGKGDVITTWIKKSFPGLKIIAASSHDDGNEKMLSVGADSVCPKHNFKNINSVIEKLSRPNHVPRNI